MKLRFGMLFLYLSSFQIITLSQHFRMNMLLDLYPVDLVVLWRSVMHLLITLATIQVVLFTILLLIKGLFIWSLGMFVGGLLFMVAFFLGYVKKKLNTF